MAVADMKVAVEIIICTRVALCSHLSAFGAISRGVADHTNLWGSRAHLSPCYLNAEALLPRHLRNRERCLEIGALRSMRFAFCGVAL